jgi:hypothetical protein
MILRIWHGRTSRADAEAYQGFLDGEVITGFMARGIAGLRSAEVLRRDIGDDEVEFSTIMTFDDWAAVQTFAGPDHTAAVIPPAALRWLRSYDTEPQHYDLVAHHGNSVT